MTVPGYTAEPQGIFRYGKASAEEAERVRGILHDVREAFVAAGRPMGHDQYGAQMEKDFPSMRDGIINAFNDYIDQLEGVGDGMGATAVNYRAAEHPRT
ncbi:hypothetical protein ACGFNP_20915 [Nonomuraea sp. NPDC049269]|uniref:hypothetical protein n=1 Tax=Nonomuraea sp. NPDC049269 TaxID=3364349 RepID=UPI003719688B